MLQSILAFIVSLFTAFMPHPQAASVIRPSVLTATLAPKPTQIPSPTPISTPTPSLKPTPIPTAAPPVQSGPPGAGLSTISVVTPKGTFTVTVMSFDLSTTRVVTDSSTDDTCDNNCAVMNLSTFVSKNGGFAGVNGSYFCPSTYPDCASKTNTFDSPLYNSRLHKWIQGGHLGWGGLSLFYTDGGGAHYHQNSTDYPSAPDSAIINYPGLVNDGNVQIDDNQSGLSDKQRSVGTKVGIGTTGPNNVLVVVANAVNMQQFAYVFKSLGATGALNLDTGGSTALYYSGRYIYGPGRDLPNSIVFVRK